MAATRISDRSVITADPTVNWQLYADQSDEVADDIEAEVKLTANQPTLLYLEQSAAASGVGTLADPITISTNPETAWTDLLTRLAAIEGTYTSGFRLQFMGGDAIDIRRANTAYTPGVAFAHLLMQDPDDGTRAKINSWYALSVYATASPSSSGSWTDEGDGSWTIALTPGTTLVDIMVEGAIDDIEDARYGGNDAVLLAIDTSTAQTIAAANCNHVATHPSNALRVWPRGGTDPWDIQWYVCPSRTTPIIATPTNGFALVGGHVANGDYSSGAAYLLRGTANSQIVVKDCLLGSVKKHTVGIAAGTTTGAQMLVRGCESVGGPADSSGFNQFVCFTQDTTTAGEEPDLLVMDTIVRGTPRGQFTSSAQYRSASPVFAHTGDSGTVGSAIAVRVDARQVGWGGIQGVITAADQDGDHLYAEVGCRLHNEPFGTSNNRLTAVQTMAGTVPFSGGHYSAVYRHSPTSSVIGYEALTSGTAARPHSNNLFDVTVGDFTAEPAGYRPFMWGVSSGLSTAEVVGWGNTFVARREVAGTDFAWFHTSGTFSAGQKCQQFESYFLGVGAASGDIRVERDHDMNADATSADIGMLNCGFHSIVSAGYTSSGNPIVLATALPYNARPAATSTLILADAAVPSGRDLAVDRLGNTRYAASPTIGCLAGLIPPVVTPHDPGFEQAIGAVVQCGSDPKTASNPMGFRTTVIDANGLPDPDLLYTFIVSRAASCASWASFFDIDRVFGAAHADFGISGFPFDGLRWLRDIGGVNGATMSQEAIDRLQQRIIDAVAYITENYAPVHMYVGRPEWSLSSVPGWSPITTSDSPAAAADEAAFVAMMTAPGADTLSFFCNCGAVRVAVDSAAAFVEEQDADVWANDNVIDGLSTALGGDEYVGVEAWPWEGTTPEGDTAIPHPGFHCRIYESTFQQQFGSGDEPANANRHEMSDLAANYRWLAEDVTVLSVYEHLIICKNDSERTDSGGAWCPQIPIVGSAVNADITEVLVEWASTADPDTVTPPVLPRPTRFGRTRRSLRFR